MFDFIKKKAPKLSMKDFEELIDATSDASPETHVFLVPETMGGDFRVMIRNPFLSCIWTQHVHGYPIQPTDDNKLELITYRELVRRVGYAWCGCR